MDPLCGIARGYDDDKMLVCEWRDGHDDMRPATATTTTATVGDVRMQAVSVLTR